MSSIFASTDGCTAVVSDDAGSSCTAENAPYGYVPHTWVGGVMTGVYAALLFFHLSLSLLFYLLRRRDISTSSSFRRPNTLYTLFLSLASAGELCGWVARLHSSFQPFDSDAYICQVAALIISPVFVTALLYWQFEIIVRHVGSSLALIRPKILLILLVIGDVLSLIVQAVGGGLSASASDNAALDVGSQVALAGVCIQVIVTVPYTYLVIDYHVRHYLRYLHFKQENKNTASSDADGKQLADLDVGMREQQRWTRKMLMLSGATLFSTLAVLIRCFYRVAELHEGWTGVLAHDEKLFVVLDGFAIALSIAIFLPLHPAWLLPFTASSDERASIKSYVPGVELCTTIVTHDASETGHGLATPERWSSVVSSAAPSLKRTGSVVLLERTSPAAVPSAKVDKPNVPQTGKPAVDFRSSTASTKPQA